MNVTLSLIVTLMLAASPIKQLPAFVGQTKQNLSVPIEELRNAPTTVVVDNRSLHLSAYPWRDFTPGSAGLEGSPMMIAFKVTSADKQSLPSGLRMDRAWVLFGEQVWEVSNLRGGKPDQDHDKDSWIKCPVSSPVCEISVHGGPRWGAGVYVDVVVRLTDSEGRKHFLQAPNQFVIATS